MWQRLVQRPCDAFLRWARRPCNRTDDELCAEMRELVMQSMSFILLTIL